MFRDDFPFFHSQSITYLDSAATTQRLGAVIDTVNTFARDQNASVHRSAYPLANEATGLFEQSRASIAKLIHAKVSDEVVFTSGATESLNMIANGIQPSMLSGNVLLLCASEHHANILPWQKLAARLNLSIRILELGPNGRFTEETLTEWLSIINDDVALIACAHASNVLGNIYPIDAICRKAREVSALSVIDGTQAIAHMQVDVQKLGCDFYVFSGHKMYGPTGIGVMWGKYEHLEKLEATKLGGEMVNHVTYESYTTEAPPLKFEAGTPNIMGAIGLFSAAQYFGHQLEQIVAHEHALYTWLSHKMANIDGITVYGNIDNSISVLSFRFDSLDNHSAALMLYQKGFALRFGQHCAMPLLDSLGIDACLRVSIGCYNTASELERFVDAVNEIITPEGSTFEHQVASEQSAPIEEPHGAWEQALFGATSWAETHRQLLLLSKQLPLLCEAQRHDLNRVEGCEASVWLDKQPRHNDGHLRGYSDSKVVRGLMTVLLLKHHQNLGLAVPIQANEFDFEAYLADLGLSSYFSEGRKDGMKALIQRIQAIG
ncbi:aminotransferase class V-fold PLP-dependent enzyme [Glaciecola sp. XM2]|uniref:aminotransferase class V-fold PLP-dependent enzyme n=1 Tax=Glaciecola sp. XM2 TaxID=1914931 RepID=UPI001BDF37C1|nr:aminotransferase class V-fold PLP-dependent enzyme [Glaciecola sp. XM2]MBT1449738.1 aminotransferase class V-fold PLP-dependent enzyme [Glaciecola sp. XM2]